MEAMTRVLAPGLGSWKNGWYGWMTKMWEQIHYMWDRVGLQGFLDDPQEVSNSEWLLACILDAVISEVSVALNCFRI